jgi:ATP-dependent protease ClpP protease subunit
VICPNDVRRAVENCTEDDELVLEISSTGGSVYAGFEIYNVIRQSGRKTTAEVYSIAGSAASVIAVACGTVLMSPVSNMMIHRSALSYTGGNAQKLKQNVQMLETIDESILNAYEEKAAGKTSRTKLRHMIENETFLTAQEAIDCGLADGILEKPDQNTQADPMSAVASMGNSGVNIGVLFARSTLPPVDDLRRMMEEREKLNTDSSKKPEDVQNKAKPQEEGFKVEDEKKNEIKSVEQLLAAYPDLAGQLTSGAAEAERKRIASIDAVALPGFEKIIAEAKADPKQTAGTAAMAIIMAQKEQGKTYLDGARKDAKAANDVESTPAPKDEGEEKSVEDEAKAAVELFEKSRRSRKE